MNDLDYSLNIMPFSTLEAAEIPQDIITKQLSFATMGFLREQTHNPYF